MLKKKAISSLLLIALLALGRPGQSQVVMTTQLPPSGITQKSQLWNLLLVNSSPAAMDIQIELTLLDLQSNQAVLTGTTRVMQLPKGAKVIQWADVQPVSYNAVGGAGIDANPNGFLPAGNYRVCFTVMRFASDIKEAILEECTEIEIAPLSPPQLMLPADKDTLDVLYPQFSWIPPAPLHLFQRLRYDLRLVELLPGQSIGEAIQHNVPLTQSTELTPALFLYPASSKPLDKGRDYLWQVTARDVNGYSIQTEVWQFHIKDVQQRQAATGTAYTRLRKGLTPAVSISQGFLRFVYTNQLGDTAARYMIYTTDGSKEVRILSEEISLGAGENFIELPLEGKRGLQDGGQYRFQLVNAKGEKWEMQFIFRIPTNRKENQ